MKIEIENDGQIINLKDSLYKNNSLDFIVNKIRIFDQYINFSFIHTLQGDKKILSTAFYSTLADELKNS